MRTARDSTFVALAVQGTGFAAVLAGLVRPVLERGWDPAGPLTLGMSLGHLALCALPGGSLVLPLAILALRGTPLAWTIPICAVPTIAAAFAAGYLWTPFHAASACLVAGGVALSGVRCLRPRRTV